jgi:hypothetical protein
VARIARQIYDAAQSELDLLGGAGVVSPELAALARQQECARYESQQEMVAYLAKSGRLRDELNVTQAREILWALTGCELYRMLVIERGWSSDEYEQWLEGLLTGALLKKRSNGARAEGG